MNIVGTIKHTIQSIIEQKYGVGIADYAGLTVTVNAADNTFGDISTNAAMVVAKSLKKNPREIATQLIELLQNSVSSSIESICIAGPGFINITLQKSAWVRELAKMQLENRAYFHDTKTPARRYLMEYVSANPTGPVHLGGGRGGIIGDVIANVLQLLGHEVCREYYINDAGNQIKLLGASLQARCLQELGQAVQLPEGGYAGAYLIEVAKRCVAEHGNSVVSQPAEFFEQYAKDALLVLIKQDLAEYGVAYDSWFSEKSLHTDDSVAQALNALIEKGLAYEKEGALWFRSELFGDAKDRVLRKSNGEMTYIAADVAYHKNKFDRGFDHLIDILGQDHHGYIVRLKATMEALGYPAKNLDIIVYQLVTIKENDVAVRMSKRAGNFTQLRDVVDTVGRDCARFFYLNRKVEAHLEFDLEVALKKTDENPVFYIQYAYVRTGSVLAKAVQEGVVLSSDAQALFGAYTLTEQDIVLVRKLVLLHDVLHGVAYQYHSHALAYYALELAQVFHNYYAHNRVVDSSDMHATAARLYLVERVRQQLGLCLELLGLSKPERM